VTSRNCNKNTAPKAVNESPYSKISLNPASNHRWQKLDQNSSLSSRTSISRPTHRPQPVPISNYEGKHGVKHGKKTIIPHTCIGPMMETGGHTTRRRKHIRCTRKFFCRLRCCFGRGRPTVRQLPTNGCTCVLRRKLS